MLKYQEDLLHCPTEKKLSVLNLFDTGANLYKEQSKIEAFQNVHFIIGPKKDFLYLRAKINLYSNEKRCYAARTEPKN